MTSREKVREYLENAAAELATWAMKAKLSSDPELEQFCTKIADIVVKQLSSFK